MAFSDAEVRAKVSTLGQPTDISQYKKRHSIKFMDVELKIGVVAVESFTTHTLMITSHNIASDMRIMLFSRFK